MKLRVQLEEKARIGPQPPVVTQPRFRVVLRQAVVEAPEFAPTGPMPGRRLADVEVRISRLSREAVQLFEDDSEWVMTLEKVAKR